MENNFLIRCLDYLIEWMDAAIIRVSIVLLTVGFIMGTVNMLTPSYDLTNQPAFDMIWSVVQAIALDGLFVGVLFRIGTIWSDSTWSVRSGYLSITLLLGSVAAIINCTLSYQQMNHLGIASAMQQLGISPIAFVYARAVLVVIVMALVCTVLRRNTYVEGLHATIEQLTKDAISLEETNASDAAQYARELAEKDQEILELREESFLQLEAKQLEISQYLSSLTQVQNEKLLLAEKASSLASDKLNCYPKLNAFLESSGAKTMNVDTIADLTGHPKRRINKAIADKALTLQSRNKEVLVSSLLKWLQEVVVPPVSIEESNGHTNGHSQDTDPMMLPVYLSIE